MEDATDIYEALARINAANEEFLNSTSIAYGGGGSGDILPLTGTYNIPYYTIATAGTNNNSINSFNNGMGIFSSVTDTSIPAVEELRNLVNSLRTEVAELKKRLDTSEQLRSQPEHRRISPKA